MSVTVSDVLKLPSLRHATVVGGENGLSKMVSGISVLESIDPQVLVDNIFRSGEFMANELVITGFLNCTDNVDLQCANIRRMAEGGEVGLILFYVGVYMQEVDRRLIDLANSLDFVLIQMPVGEKELRYGEVITEVMECIFRDREKGDSMVADILARITALPEHQRSVSTTLKILSDRLMASVVLTDCSLNILNLAAWPSNMADLIIKHQKQLGSAMQTQGNSAYLFLPDCLVYHSAIVPESGPQMELFILKEGSQLSQSLWENAVDVVRLGINIWGKQHGSIAISELIRSILQDDPMKMRRLADIFHIPIEKIHEMWIFSGSKAKSLEILQEEAEQLRETLLGCADIVFSDIYEDELLMFSSTPYSVREAEKQLEAMLQDLSTRDDSVTIFRSGGLQTTTEVRQAYLGYKEYISDAKKIFPLQKCFSLGEIEFAQTCHALIDDGELAVNRCSDKLRQLHGANDEWSALETLAVFLLDAGMHVTQTAQLLHVHNNTVKYRINVITDLLGFRPGKMPDSMPLFEAVAVQRLLQ